MEGHETSGEVEYVLLVDGNRIYVAVGSDHTDRELERIEIRSWVLREGERTLYQDSTLATIIPPEELIRSVQPRVKSPLKGIAIFSGTPPLVTEKIVFTDRFEAELFDPVLMRKITIGYSIHTLDWFRA